MTLLVAKMLVRCPRMNCDVEVKKQCLDCEHYKHTSFIGHTPHVACSYEKKSEPKDEGVGGLKRW